MAATGPAAKALAHDGREKERAERRQQEGGDASRWPAASMFWVVLTDKQLHVFEGQPNSQNHGAGPASYALQRIGSMDYDKKLLIRSPR